MGAPVLGLNVTTGTIGLASAGTGGTGSVPSWPTRKTLKAGLALSALHPVPLGPVILQAGAERLRACSKQTPSAGMIKLLSVFFRTYTIPQTARCTVFKEPVSF